MKQVCCALQAERILNTSSGCSLQYSTSETVANVDKDAIELSVIFSRQ